LESKPKKTQSKTQQKKSCQKFLLNTIFFYNNKFCNHTT
jgi:hypothetical protein